MPVEPPFHTYREQLWSLYQGLALWKPNPGGLYNRVSIGDVGYVSEGAFIRMFNVSLPWDDESNRTFGIPDCYDPLGVSDLSIRRETFGEVDHYSRYVFRDENANNVQAASPKQADGVAYSCRGRGALLSLPHGGCREDAVQMKTFEKYIQDNVVSWFTWAQKKQLDVERMEDLILVTGCTLVTTWAAAVFTDRIMSAEISLASRTLRNGGTSFTWSNVRGPIVHHDCRLDPQNSLMIPDQCVFIKGFRAKRVLFRIKPLRAAAEPFPDDPDNRRDGDIHVTSVPGVPKYCDPLIGVLDYIAEKCIEGAIAEDIMAIAHDDDLHFTEGMKTVTADEIEKHLHERNMPLLVESGAAILHIPHSNTSPVSSEKQLEVASYETADSNCIASIPQHISPESPSTTNTPSGLPSLPKIRSQPILEQIFTHRSLSIRPNRVFKDPCEVNLDNVILISIGGQVFDIVATDLIRETFPNLSVGPSSKVKDHLKDRLKDHERLAKTAVQYGLPERLRVQAAQADEAKRSVHGQAEVFKAYVGGLYRNQGFDVVSTWLRSLLLLDIKETYESMRKESDL